MNAAPVRDRLIHALKLDLVGPDGVDPRDAGLANEVLEIAPSQWYLTGFLVPSGANPELFDDETATEQITSGRSSADDGEDEDGPARRPVFPSSIGITVLVRPGESELEATVRWATYAPSPVEKGGTSDRPLERGSAPSSQWTRTPHEATVMLPLEPNALRRGSRVPDSDGLVVLGVIRAVRDEKGELDPTGTRVVTVFLVNQRPAVEPGPEHDTAVAFQVSLELHSRESFVERPNRRGGDPEDDFDEKLGELQYRDAFEYAVGHGVAVESTVQGTGSEVWCDRVRTTWVPIATVARVIPSDVRCELRMDALGTMDSAGALRAAVTPLATAYRAWIKQQRQTTLDPGGRRELASQLLDDAGRACDRLEAGLAAMDDPLVFEAFCRANRAMADAARQRNRNTYLPKEKGGEGKTPTWRPFQLAFLLMNVVAQADPTHAERDIVDLIFFPTGGGKTEAYLGLAAYTMVLRRLRNPGIASAGVCVLMRYTLRLLTLDQYARAATLICALELQRRENPDRLGPQRFAIGLWVGKAATPNRFGSATDRDETTARARVLAFRKKPASAQSPIPLDKCPWCGEPFGQDTFRLLPDENEPTQLRVKCTGVSCKFRWSERWPEGLPILAVDGEIYGELPPFLIATVDKFASLPWVGRTGMLLGKNVTHRTPDGKFHGGADAPPGVAPMATPLLPPDLIIQDELHLISGPLGTIAGLYETAIDALASRMCSTPDGKSHKIVRPKIVASTATVRNARAQVRALFARSDVRVFPPPGPNRETSFFAETLPVKSTDKGHPRTYVGIAAPGRSMKVLLLRAYVVLLGAAQRAFEADRESADPYMTLVGYFNSLRELGGSRRIVEDEVGRKLERAGRRRRVSGESASGDERLATRRISYECVELTSRETIEKIKIAKERLETPFGARSAKQREPVDVALASNMISVGVDIERIGLMVIAGQPKTAAEYIQASSRVGRAQNRPGLVVTLLNAHKPRDRSHLEHFEAFHQSFYRAVEATSVTPFSARAIDRGLAGVAVALARLGEPLLTPPEGAAGIAAVRQQVCARVVDALVRRAEDHRSSPPADQSLAELKQVLRARVEKLFDAWVNIANDPNTSRTLAYQRFEGRPNAMIRPLLRMPLDEELRLASRYEREFQANRSMRDVEPPTDIMVMTQRGAERALEDEAQEGGS